MSIFYNLLNFTILTSSLKMLELERKNERQCSHNFGRKNSNSFNKIKREKHCVENTPVRYTYFYIPRCVNASAVRNV